MSGHMPTIYRPGGEIVPPNEVLAHLAREEVIRQAHDLERARENAVRGLLRESDQYESGTGARRRKVPRKTGWSKLSHHFHIDLRIVAVESRWEQLEHDDVEHFVAHVTVEGQAPWGAVAQAARICTTREDKFGKWDHEQGRQIHNWIARQGAENACTGIAQTRAEHAVIDRLLGLGALDDIPLEDDEVLRREREEEDLKRRKQEARARQAARTEWKKILELESVTEEAEQAFYRLNTAVPDDLEEFTRENILRCISIYKRRGREIFDLALEQLQKREEAREPNEEEPEPAETEQGPDPALQETDQTSDSADFERSLREDPMGTDAAGELPLEDELPEPKMEILSSCYARARDLGEEERTYVEAVARRLFPAEFDAGGLVALEREDLKKVLHAIEGELREGGP